MSFVVLDMSAVTWQNKRRQKCIKIILGTEYEFMVLCKDDNGDGPFSKSVRVWTKTEQQHETNLYKGGLTLKKYMNLSNFECFRARSDWLS